MKVHEIMTPNPASCGPAESLTQAAKLMWENDCGFLPVVTEEGQVLGVITDRDICMAAATQGRRINDVAVREVLSGRVYSVGPEEDMQAALGVMQNRRVRRLLVINAAGALEGVLSLNDVVLNAQQQGPGKPELSYSDVIETYQSICGHFLHQDQFVPAGM
jgi:CBS domain-containing protein